MLLPPITFLRDKSSRDYAHDEAVRLWLVILRMQQSEALGAISFTETDFLATMASIIGVEPSSRHRDQALLCFDLVSAATVCEDRFALVCIELERQVAAIQALHGHIGLILCRRLLRQATTLICLDQESQAFCLEFAGCSAEVLELPVAARMNTSTARAAVVFVHDHALLKEADAAQVLPVLAGLGLEVTSLDLDVTPPVVTDDQRQKIPAAPFHVHLGSLSRTLPGFRIADSLGQRAIVAHMRSPSALSVDADGRDIEIRDLFNGFIFSAASQLEKIVRTYEGDSFLKNLFQRNTGQALLAFNTPREAMLLNWIQNSAQNLSTLK